MMDINESKIIMGSDPGYGWNKHVFSKFGNNVWDSRVFPSLYTENPPESTNIEAIDESDPFSPNFHEYFTFGVRKLDDPYSKIRTFAVGDGVRDFTRKIAHESFAIQRDNTKVTDWIVSIIAMLAVTQGVSEYSVGLTVPINQMEDMKQYLKEHNIKGDYEVYVHNEPNFNITKKVRIDSFYLLEQAIAALYNEVYTISEEGVPIYKDKSLTKKKVIVIDLGTNTINYALVENMHIINKNRKPEAGAAKLIQRIQEELESYSIDMSYSNIQKKLMFQSRFIVNYFNKKTEMLEDMDITDKIEQIKKDVFKTIISPTINSIIASSAGKEADIDKVLFTGGGVKLFAKFLKPRFSSSRIIIPEHPQLANAIGTWKSVYIAEYKKRS